MWIYIERAALLGWLCYYIVRASHYVVLALAVWCMALLLVAVWETGSVSGFRTGYGTGYLS
jgi:hypothetical protein